MEKGEEMRYRELLCKRPLVKCMNMEYITETIWNIMDEANNTRWAIEDDEILIDILGDEDYAEEFKVAFSDLASDAERLVNDLQNEYIVDCFDLFFTGIASGEYMGGYIGYDEVENDYFSIEYPHYLEEEAYKKIVRMKKEDIIHSAGQCFKIAMVFTGIQSRYDDLKSAIEVIKGKAKISMSAIKGIEEAYNNENWSRLDRIADDLPEEIWF